MTTCENDCTTQLDRAYLTGLLKGVNTCRVVYANTAKKDNMDKVFSELAHFIEADLAMAVPLNRIPQA